MWESINKDPLIRAIVVIILGLIVFGLVFNIMFGSNAMGGEMGYNASSLNAFDSLLKIAIIAAFVVGAIKLYKYVDSQLAAGSNGKGARGIMQGQPNNVFLIVLISLVALVAIIAMTPGMLGSRGMTYAYYNHYPVMQNNVVGAPGVLVTLAKVLMFVSGISFIIAIVAYFANNLRAAQSIPKPEHGAANANKACDKCGFSLNADWKCCPKCGYDLEKHDAPAEAEVEEVVIVEEKVSTADDLVERIYQDDKDVHKKNKQKNKKQS